MMGALLLALDVEAAPVDRSLLWFCFALADAVRAVLELCLIGFI